MLPGVGCGEAIGDAAKGEVRLRVLRECLPLSTVFAVSSRVSLPLAPNIPLVGFEFLGLRSLVLI